MANPIAIQTLSGATPTWDALYKFAEIESTGNTTITVENIGTPDAGSLTFVNGGTHTLDVVAMGNSYPITVGSGAGAVSEVQWKYTGNRFVIWAVTAEEGAVVAITPDAPTGGTVDNTADTFTFTLNPSYAASEHEYNLNGAGYVACSSNVISVGNVAVGIGDLLVRVKAATGRNASATLANATAFTVASGVIVLDNFTGTDGTILSAHTIAPTNTPNAFWSHLITGGLTLDGNRMAATASTNGAGGYVDCGLSDVTVSAVVNRAGTAEMAVLFRYLDNDNFWLAHMDHLGAFNIYEKTGGTFTQRATTPVTFNAGTDYTIEIALSGNSLTATVDGGNTLSHTSSTGATRTKHGIWCNAGSGSVYFDSFQIIA